MPLATLTPLTRSIAPATSRAPSATPAAARSIVGGWVRDRLLGRESKNIDLEVFGVPGVGCARCSKRSVASRAVGESFQVYKIGDIDVSLPRRDSKAGRGHRGFVVIGDPEMSIEEAARRRDFTINGISWDPLTDEYLDPFDGRGDLERRAPAHGRPGDVRRRQPARAARGPVRRALRRSRSTTSTRDALPRRFRSTICRPSAIWGEFEKLLFAPRPSIGFALALDLGVVARLFPELQALVGCPQEPEWHPEGDVWVHTLQVIDQARTRIDDLPRPQQLAVMLGAVCHDLGKPATTAFIDGRIRSMDHEEQGVAPATALLDRLNVHSIDGYDVRRQVLGITAQHLKPGIVVQGARRSRRRRVPPAGAEGRPRAARASRQVRLRGTRARRVRLHRDGLVPRARARARRRACRPPEPILLGRHLLALGLKPGPRVGEILKAVYEQQLDGTMSTLDEAVARARQLVDADHLTPRTDLPAHPTRPT